MNRIYPHFAALAGVLFFISICVGNLCGQQPLQNILDLRELTDNPVFDIRQDKSGLIWLATLNGLYDFNGIACNKKAENIDSVKNVLPIEQELFFTDNRRLYTFDLKKNHIKCLNPKGFSQKIRSLAQAFDGLMITFADSGFAFFSLKDNMLKDSILPNLAFQSVVSFNKEVIVGNFDGLFVLKKNKDAFSCDALSSGFPPGTAVKALSALSGSMLYVGDFEGNIHILDKSYKASDKIVNPFEGFQIKSVIAEQNDLILLGETQVLRYLKDVKIWLKHSFLEIQENEKGILSSSKDQEGNIWIGSKNTGLYRYGLAIESVPNGFEQIKMHLSVNSVFAPDSGTIFFANENGVFRLIQESGQMKSYPFTRFIKEKIVVTCMNKDKSGNIWMGTFDKGIYVISPDGKNQQHFEEREGLLNANILNFYFYKNQVWICAFGGISVADIEGYKIGNSLTFKNFSASNGFVSNYTYQVVNAYGTEDLYFVTDGNGAIRYRNEKFETLKELGENKTFYAVFADRLGNLGFLSGKNELFLYKKQSNQYENFALRESGKNDFQFAAFDHSGDILLGYPDGFMVLESHSNQFRDYGRAYLMGKVEPNENCYSAWGNNRMLIGTAKGILVYTPIDSLALHQARIRLDAVEVELEKIDTTLEKEFPYDHNHITFHFSGFWYTEPEVIRFRYKLTGINKDWIITKDRFVNFANLPPGKYNFTVQATIHHNFEDAESVSFSFEICPPLWSRVWFIALMFFLMILGVFVLFRLREKQLYKEASMKKQKIEFELQTLKNQINPHFLFNSLNTLAGVIEEEPKNAVTYVEKLSAFYRNILKYRDREVITLKEEWQILDDYLYILSQRFQNNIKMEVHIEEDCWNWYIPAFTLQMLLENAVKHNIIAKARPLKIIITANLEGVTVCNTLQPKQSVMDSTGIGLKNIDTRFRLLTGEGIEVRQTNNQFNVHFKLIHSNP